MNKRGEIVIIEDDNDDRELLQMAFSQLESPNPVVYFENCIDAYDYFNDTGKDPFLIISDVNIPRMSGLELREKMQEIGEVRLRTVPFLFLTTAAAGHHIIKAYCDSVQGFFVKPYSYEELKETLKTILDYWAKCAEPIFLNN